MNVLTKLHEFGDAVVAVALAHYIPQALDVIGPANRFVANNGSGMIGKYYNYDQINSCWTATSSYALITVGEQARHRVSRHFSSSYGHHMAAHHCDHISGPIA